ncbi:MAG TPA: hypothetical protein VL403_10685 [Candidatus Kryptonia bacterium]|nr:hypothetical protein [Candidatus Kryptonia bacterium]
MLRLRFIPGVLVGLLIGLPLGALLAQRFLALHAADGAASVSQLQDLTARLERADREKEALNRQLDEFRVMAERMTASFSELERRFKGLEADVHHGEVASPESTPSPSVASDATPAS